MSQSPVDALDLLIADFAKHAGTTPSVNPPEAVKVLETQTKPEVAGVPEPALELPAAPAPTEKPAEVVAAEAAKKTRSRKPAAAAEKQADKAPESSGQTSQPDAATAQAALAAASTKELFNECRRRGLESMFGAPTEDLLAEILRRLCRALPAPDA